MCKIITIINNKPENTDKINDILSANVSALKVERQGYSVMRDNKSHYFLGPKDYDNMQENIKYKGEKVMCIHSRTSTGGSLDEKGLHLQRTGNWFWAHNGMVTGFSGVKDHSDSYYFFMSLISALKIDEMDKPISKDLIEKACQDLSFGGKGFLYNPKSKILQWFCNAQSYIYLLEDCIIITTYDLNLDVETYEYASILGFSWITKTTTEKIEVIHQETVDDIMLTFQNNQLIGRQNVTLRKYGNYNNTPQKHYNYWQEKAEQEALDAAAEAAEEEEERGAGIIRDYRGHKVTSKTFGMTKRERKAMRRLERKQKGQQSLVTNSGDYNPRKNLN